MIISALDRDITSRDDEIGFFEIPLDRLPNGKPLTGWVPLILYKKAFTELQVPTAGLRNLKVMEELPIPAGAIRVSITLDIGRRARLLRWGTKTFLRP